MRPQPSRLRTLMKCELSPCHYVYVGKYRVIASPKLMLAQHASGNCFTADEGTFEGCHDDTVGSQADAISTESAPRVCLWG